MKKVSFSSRPKAKFSRLWHQDASRAHPYNHSLSGTLGSIVRIYVLPVSRNWMHSETEGFLSVWFQKIATPTPSRVTRNSKGEGVSKAKLFKGK